MREKENDAPSSSATHRATATAAGPVDVAIVTVSDTRMSENDVGTGAMTPGVPPDDTSRWPAD